MTGLNKKMKHATLFFAFIFTLASCATSAPEDSNSSTEDLAALDRASSDSATDTNSNPADDFAEFNDEKKEEPPPAETPPPAQEPAPAPEIVQTEPAPAPVEEPPKPEPPAEVMIPEPSIINIKSVQFKANDVGGTVLVDADGPMTYTSKLNAQSGQFIIEIPNSKLPKSLQRPLITREFESSIGTVEPFQSAGSNVTRIVVQLKPGATEPIVQSEGNSLLVVSSPMPKKEIEQVQLLSFDSLEEFLAGNMNFGGKKVSIETDDIDLKDLFKLISEEGGVNLVIADEVKGKMSVKLRQVPWDQALVMIMKAKKLSYSRTGNILRIAPIADLRAEEDETIKMANSKKTVAPIKVKLLPISYAKIEDLEKQVKPFLSPRGNVVGDQRTNSLVISDIEENLERSMRIVQSIDIPPQQVLIEGKIVEASDTFERQVGVNWSAGGRATTFGGATSSVGPIRSSMNASIIPGRVAGETAIFNFTFGTLDILGDLSASLSLREKEGTVKVLSSPRVVTMHNEPAKISQTTQLPIITSTPQANGNPIPQVAFKDVKLELNVTPTITNDGGVIMLVDVMRDIAGDIADPNTQARPLNSRSAKTKVLVRNGQTAVIGGIYQNDVTEKEFKVPMLGNIPILGWLFKSKAKTDEKIELMIFLTPRILGQLDGSIGLQPKSGGEL